MRRRELGVLVVALVAGILGVSLSTASARSQVTTLTLLQPTTFQIAQDALIKNFERAYPNIHIQVTYLDSSLIPPLLATQYQSGNAPDMFWAKPGRERPTAVWPLAQAGKLLDLTGSPWRKRVYPPSRKFVSWGGKVYGFPGVITPYVGIYNTDLFKQLGLKLPTRQSDTLALCKKISAAGKIPIVEPFGNVAAGSIVGTQRMDQYVYSVDPNWNSKRAAGKTSFASSPLWRQALQSIADWKNAGCFQDGAAGTSRQQQYTMLAQGQAAMSVVATVELPNILRINPNFHYAFFNLPPDNPKNAAVAANAVFVLSANSSTKYPNEVRTFINFVARDGQDRLLATASGGIAPFDMQKAKLPASMKLLLPFAKAGKLFADPEADWPNDAMFISAYSTGIQGLITGQKTVDDILADMDKAWAAGTAG